MKPRFYWLIGIVICIGLFLIWLLRSTEPEPLLIQTPTITPNTTTSKLASQNPNPLPPGVTLPKGVFHSNVELETVVLQMLHATPIKFYGKVVDQDNNPIADADVTGQPSQNIMQNGATNNPLLPAKSDSDGLFSFSTHGASIAIQIHKNGYYETKSQTYFGYDPSYKPNYQPHPNPNDPAIFVMRKVGKTEPLVRIERGIDVPTDGTPIQFNITGLKRPIGQGDITVQAWIQFDGRPPVLHQHYDWKCTIKIPGGGFIPNTGGEYDFEAPADGYSDTIEIDMPASLGSEWHAWINRPYYINTKDNRFARANLIVSAEANHYFRLEGYLNPVPGHRNLEVDPDNPPKAP